MKLVLAAGVLVASGVLCVEMEDDSASVLELAIELDEV